MTRPAAAPSGRPHAPNRDSGRRRGTCPAHTFGRSRRGLGCNCAHPRRRCDPHHSAERTVGDRADRRWVAAEGLSRERQARSAQRAPLAVDRHSTTRSADGMSVRRSRLIVRSGASATVAMPASAARPYVSAEIDTSTPGRASSRASRRPGSSEGSRSRPQRRCCCERSRDQRFDDVSSEFAGGADAVGEHRGVLSGAFLGVDRG